MLTIYVSIELHYKVRGEAVLIMRADLVRLLGIRIYNRAHPGSAVLDTIRHHP